jgi:hypothetical protein
MGKMDEVGIFGRGRRWRRRMWLLRSDRGSHLAELAFTLPILLVLAVGAIDFGAGLILKDKLTNAAREGARVASSQPQHDLTQTHPPSVRSLCTVVQRYLTAADVDAGTEAICNNPCASGNFEWTYCIGNGGQIRIERQVPIDVGGVISLATRVTVTYPYAWSLDRVVALIRGDLQGSFMLTTAATMRNL